ncbi:hypothetical protein BpHYR1_003477 [Brachionus plicatilis]|uniref:Uncharacterized protein n=1 Tax=Brachionus plicatilis TaxID=10195 RepID=A0A3M7T0N6_BRAPC|nr:hypothetical protein BpHYR1_003477 [Brachionus plicatilis]
MKQMCNFAEFAQILQTSAEGETTVVSLCFIYRTILYEITQCQIGLFLTSFNLRIRMRNAANSQRLEYFSFIDIVILIGLEKLTLLISNKFPTFKPSIFDDQHKSYRFPFDKP